MANKRMFSLSVVDTDKFLEMPISSRLLYYELGMRADDDGFVDNWKKILMFTGLTNDDLKLLITKQFIIPFESGVIVIKHWRLNNYLQKDRTKPTIYQQELKQLGIDKNNVYTLDTQCIHSIDKNSIDKNSIEYIYPQKDDDLFEKFWQVYPKKLDKKNAKKSFDKINPDEQLTALIISQVNRFKDTSDWKKEDGKFIPYPSTWLNGKRWEDEFETDTEKEERIDREILEGTYGT